MQRRILINSALGTAVVAAGLVSYSVVVAGGSSTHTTETLSTAKTGIVLSSVTATGNVEAPTSLPVNFQQSGRVTEIDVAPGQHVDAGQVLAKIDDTTERSALVTAQAQLASAQASLATKLQGATPEALRQDAAGLAQSQVGFANAQTALEHAQQSAAADALKFQQAVDQANAQLAAAQQTASDNVAKYQLAVDQANQQLDAANQQLSTANDNLANDRDSLHQLQASYDPAASPSEDTNSLLNRYRLDQSDCQSSHGTNASDGVTCSEVGDLISFAQNVASAENAQAQATNAVQAAQRALDNATLAQTNGLAQDQQSVATAQRGVAAAQLGQSNGSLADQQAIENASNSVNTAEASMNATAAGNAAKEAPATADALAAARAAVASSQAAADTALRNEDETSLTAPVAGTVAAVNGLVGSMSSSSGSSSSGSSSGGSGGNSGSSSSSSSSSSGFVVLTDVNLLDVKVGFAEADASKVSVGLASTITFDALPGQSVNGKVVSLDVSSTLVSNVVTYYAHIAVDSPPAAVKPGMTAAVSVVLDKRDNVVTLPTSAVATRGNTATVTVRAGGKDSQRTIGVGLRGDNAVEIVSGLQAGDVVVTKTTSATGTGTSNIGGGGGRIGGGGGGGGVFVN